MRCPTCESLNLIKKFYGESIIITCLTCGFEKALAKEDNLKQTKLPTY